MNFHESWLACLVIRYGQLHPYGLARAQPGLGIIQADFHVQYGNRLYLRLAAYRAPDGNHLAQVRATATTLHHDARARARRRL